MLKVYLSKRVELLLLIEITLIRRDGNLNSPAIKSIKNEVLINDVKKLTSFLPETASFAQRFWHIRSTVSASMCVCGKSVSWNNNLMRYNRFCSQLCAVTSEENRKRASDTFSGVLWSVERKKSYSKLKKGTRISEVAKKKMRLSKMGAENPMYGKPAWNAGLYGEGTPRFGKTYPNAGLKGSKNPMYGKVPSSMCGVGIHGKFKGTYFRSSLELLYLIYWHEQGTLAISAENDRFKVPYVDSSGKFRYYFPDFYLPDEKILVELKPRKLQKAKNCELKFKALIFYHKDKKCEIRSYNFIRGFVSELFASNRIIKYKNKKVLDISEKQYERLIKNTSVILRDSRTD